jgi:hypothetical protein
LTKTPYLVEMKFLPDGVRMSATRTEMSQLQDGDHSREVGCTEATHFVADVNVRCQAVQPGQVQQPRGVFCRAPPIQLFFLSTGTPTPHLQHENMSIEVKPGNTFSSPKANGTVHKIIAEPSVQEMKQKMREMSGQAASAAGSHASLDRTQGT